MRTRMKQELWMKKKQRSMSNVRSKKTEPSRHFLFYWDIFSSILFITCYLKVCNVSKEIDIFNLKEFCGRERKKIGFAAKISVVNNNLDRRWSN